MPPGIKHPNHVCWDDLPANRQADFLAYDQTKFHDENPPVKKPPKARKK